MKKLVRALSLLLAMVFVLSMTVVVSADTQKTVTPYITGSVAQTDIYERTVTIKVLNLEDTKRIIVKDDDGKQVNSQKVTTKENATVSYTFTYAVSTNVKNYNEYYEVLCYADNDCETLLNSRKIYVGANQTFTFSNDTEKSNGTYDGIITGNTKVYPSYSSSGNVIDSTPYNPNKWTGYRKDSCIGIYTVKCSKLNVRAGMTTKTKKVGSLKKGTNVCVYAFDEGWAKILYEGEYRYVSAKYLKAI